MRRAGIDRRWALVLWGRILRKAAWPARWQARHMYQEATVLFAVGDGPALPHAEVVDGKHVGAAEAEDEEHFHRPGTDAADRDEAIDEFLVGEPVGFFERGNHAVDGLSGEIFHGQDFRGGEPSLAERWFAELEHFVRCGNAPARTQGFNSAENGGSGSTRDGLVGDGFHQNPVGILRPLCDAEFLRFLN